LKKFQKGKHIIIWGDVIESLSEIENNSIDLIFADPPYNIGKKFGDVFYRWKSEEAYLEWSYKWLDLCIEKLKSNGSMYVMTSTQNMSYFDVFLRTKITILSRIIWYYDSSGVQARKYFGSRYEPILFCVKDKKNYTFNTNDILVEARTGAVRKLIDYRKRKPALYNSKKVAGNVWEFTRVRYRMNEYENHPTQKPEALLTRIIKVSSNKDEIILDPFSGTFTTSFIAKKLIRKSIGIEINEEYIKIGLRRLQFTSKYKGVSLKKDRKPLNFPSRKYKETLNLVGEENGT